MDEESTTCDFSYSYGGQKPHTVTQITDAETGNEMNFTYDASGNTLLQTNTVSSSDKQMVWTEENRLSAIKAKGNVAHYIYDAGGERTLKLKSSSLSINVNGVTAGVTEVDGQFTIYANAYSVVRNNQYTKHFFLGSQRILTKISSNEVAKTFFEGNADDQVGGVDYNEIQGEQEQYLEVNNELLNAGWYRNTRGQVPSEHIKHYLLSKEHGGLSGQNPFIDPDQSINDSVSVTNPDFEYKQYYFHPDHLGSSNYLTDVAGEVYQHVEYLPFGEVFLEERNTQQERNPYLFSGKELDEETGLYYFGARYSDPVTGRFLSVDRFAEKYPTLSSYNYCANNPILFTDVNGDSIRYYFEDKIAIRAFAIKLAQFSKENLKGQFKFTLDKVDCEDGYNFKLGLEASDGGGDLSRLSKEGVEFFNAMKGYIKSKTVLKQTIVANDPTVPIIDGANNKLDIFGVHAFDRQEGGPTSVSAFIHETDEQFTKAKRGYGPGDPSWTTAIISPDKAKNIAYGGHDKAIGVEEKVGGYKRDGMTFYQGGKIIKVSYSFVGKKNKLVIKKTYE